MFLQYTIQCFTTGQTVECNAVVVSMTIFTYTAEAQYMRSIIPNCVGEFVCTDHICKDNLIRTCLEISNDILSTIAVGQEDEFIITLFVSQVENEACKTSNGVSPFKLRWYFPSPMWRPANWLGGGTE